MMVGVVKEEVEIEPWDEGKYLVDS